MKLADIRQQYPQYADLSDTQLADGFHAKFYSDVDRKTFNDAIGLGPGSRTWGEVAKDSALAVGGSFANLGADLSWLVDTVTPGDMSAVTKRAEDSAKWYEENKSDTLKAKYDQLGAADGFVETMKTAWQNPQIIPDILLGSIAYMLPTGAAARAAKTVRGGMQAVAGVGGSLEGASAARQAEEQVGQMTLEDLMVNSSEYRQRLQEGMTPEQAKRSIQNETGLTTFAVTTPIAALATLLTGSGKFESRFFKGEGGKFFEGLRKEALEEVVQESGNQFGSNVGVRTQADARQPLAEGVGQSAALGLVAGSGQAAGMGAISRLTGANAPANDEEAINRIFEAGTVDEAIDAAASGLGDGLRTVQPGESLPVYASVPETSVRMNADGQMEFPSADVRGTPLNMTKPPLTTSPLEPSQGGTPGSQIPAVDLPASNLSLVQPPRPTDNPAFAAREADLARQREADGLRAIVQRVEDDTAANAAVSGEPPTATRQAFQRALGRQPTQGDQPSLEPLTERYDAEARTIAGLEALEQAESAPKPILRSNGQPFATAAMARASQQMRNSPGAQVVPVEGGFGVLPAQSAESGALAPVASGTDPALASPASDSNLTPAQVVQEQPETAGGAGAEQQAVENIQDLAEKSGKYTQPSQVIDATPQFETRQRAELQRQAQEAYSAEDAAAIESSANEAATSPQNDLPQPTDAQKEAGNYRKGHIKVQGLDITVENPAGSKRSGTDPDGKPWEHEMQQHYGYIKRTEGADGEQVDVFVGQQPFSKKVFVVDQVNKDGSFDEHKIMVGFRNQDEAVAAYKSNYDEGWKVGPVTEMTTDSFKAWLKDSDNTVPVSGPITGADSSQANRQPDAKMTSSAPAVAGSVNPADTQQSLGQPKLRKGDWVSFPLDADGNRQVGEISKLGEKELNVITRDGANIKIRRRGAEYVSKVRQPDAMSTDEEIAARAKPAKAPSPEPTTAVSKTSPEPDTTAAAISEKIPRIITAKREKYLGQMVKAARLKKESPGYDRALAEVEKQYDRELDQAYASLTFDQYNDLNKDIPEELNRQAWNALREEAGGDTLFSQDEGEQPWKMTKKQWNAERERIRPNVAQSNFTKASGSQAATSMKRLEWLTYGAKKDAQDKLRAAERGEIKLKRDEVDDLLEEINSPVSHEDVVRKAIREGKQVPENVRAEYEARGQDTLFSQDDVTSAQTDWRGMRFSKPRTPEFRNWYGNSAVKSVVFHATTNEFDAFDTERSDLGAHFGTLDQAENIVKNRLGSRGTPRIIPVWLSIQNPLRLKDVGSFHADGIARQLEQKGMLPKGEGKRIEKEIDADWKLRKKYDPMLRKIIKDAGYDGVVYKNTATGEGPGDSYIAFEPTQIKSATDNSGAFDPDNASILASQSWLIADTSVKGMSVEEVTAAIAEPMKRLKQQFDLDVTVVARPSDVGIRSDKKYRGAYHNGAVYLFADNLQSARGAQVTLAHELIGHKGILESATPEEWGSIKATIDRLKMGNKAAKDIWAETERRYPDKPLETKYKEFLAIAAEKRELREKLPSLWEKAKAMLRRIFKSLGFQMLSDSDLEIILSNSERYLRESGEAMQSDESLASQEREENEAAEAKGLPMDQASRYARAEEMGFDTSQVWYHGTQADFDAFKASNGRFGKGVYLDKSPERASGYASNKLRKGKFGRFVETDGSGANVIPVFVKRGAAQVYLGQQAMVSDPSAIRSINAAFDPDYSASADLLAMVAYHGTPHKFDKFSLDAVGTGEGAQAYGWGLYFAGKKEVAKWYTGNEGLGGASVPYFFEINGKRTASGTPEQKAADLVYSAGLPKARSLSKSMLKDAESGEGWTKEKGVGYYRNVASIVQSIKSKAEVKKARGTLYQVDIPEDSELLDWDTPLSKQPESVREGIERIIASGVLDPESVKAIRQFDASGAAIYKIIASDTKQPGSAMDSYPGARDASTLLNKHGIPGLRYFDADSRKSLGSKTQNYVIWDESRVTVEAVNDQLVQAEEKDSPLFSQSPQTDTPEFKRWFGKSVVTKNGKAGGEPLVAYHGTYRNFTKFKPGTEGVLGPGIYFSKDPDEASLYAGMEPSDTKGQVIPVYLKIENPISEDDAAELEMQYRSGISRELQKRGYDGIIGHDTIVVFRPEQVKSAIGNRGTFDDSANILFSQSGPSEFEEENKQQFMPPEDTLVSVAVRKMQDKFKVLKDLQSNIKESGGKISDENDAYLAEELFHGKAENDLRTMRDAYVEPLADKMAKFNISREQLDLYLYARHAKERNAHIATINPKMPDGGSGMTNAEADKILALVKKTGKQAKYDQLAAIVDDMLQLQRDMILSGGLEDDGTINAWESTYEHYVPLKGWAEDTKDQGKPRAGTGFNIRGPESRRALGRKSKAASPVSYAITDLTEKVIRRRKNEVGNAFLKLVQDNPNPAYWEVFTEKNPAMDRRIVKVKDPETGEVKDEVKTRPLPMGMMPDRFFATKKDGKTYYIRLNDERLMTAMKNLGPQSTNAIIRVMGGFNRIMSALNTSYSPEFLVSNFTRDIQTAILNMQAEQSLPEGSGRLAGKEIATKTIKDIPVAMRAIYTTLRGQKAKGGAVKWQEYFNEFREDGAKTGYFDMKDLDGVSADMDRLVAMAQGGAKGNAMRFLKESADFIEHLNGSVENAIRLSMYVNARNAGITRKRAASLAKNATVNFNRRGEVGTTLNALYMFANASIQGTANFVRTMTTLKSKGGGLNWKNLNNAQKIAVGITAGAFFLAAANRMGAGDDDDGDNWYDKVPDYVKERNLVIMKSLFGGEQNGEYWKIPLPYGYNVFYVLGDKMESIFSGAKSVPEAVGNITMAALGSFSPIGYQDSNTAAGALLKNAAPTIAKPVVELAMNENFMGSTIFTENLPFGTPSPDSSLGRQSTPEMYKKLATWLNETSGGSEFRSGDIDVNPDVMQYLIDYFGGSAYAFFASKLPEYAYRKAAGMVVEPGSTPFLSRIQGRVLPYQDMDLFYSRRDEIAQRYDEYRSLPDSERARYEGRDKLRLRGLLKNSESQLSRLRKQRDRIYNMDIPAKDRDDRLGEVEARMKSVVDRFNRRYAETE